MDDNLSYEFDSFRLIPAERQLLRDGQRVSLPPKVFETLLVLLQNNGHALSKEDLMNRLWPNSFVEENSLNHNISVIRKALNGGGNGDGYVETVRGYGFRFNADVRAGNPQPVLLRRTAARVVFTEEQSETVKTTTTTVTTHGSPMRLFATVALVLFVFASVLTGAYFLFVRSAHSRGAGVTPVASASQPRTENVAAREAYLKGRYFLAKRTHDGVLKAQYEFNQALTIDPNYARAYSGLADCMLMGAAYPGSMSAKELAQKAIALDDSVAEGHASLAYDLSAVEWDWAGAESEFQKAISLDPNYATARHWHAYNLASMGRLDEALAEIRKAEELDPISPIIKTDVGHILYLARHYDEAVSQYLKALEVDPNFRVAHWRLGEAYIQLGKTDEAEAELRKAMSLDQPQAETEVWLACAQASRHRDETLKILERRKVDAELRHQTYYVGLIYSMLGDKDSAIKWLEKAVGFHEGTAALLKVEPMLNDLRGDPRYAELLKRMNLN